MTRVERAAQWLDRVGFFEVATAVSLAGGVPLYDVLEMRSHEPEVVSVRHEIWSLLHGTLGLGYSTIARGLGCDHTTVSNGIKKRERRLAA